MTEEPALREAAPVRNTGAESRPQNLQAEPDARPRELPPRGFHVPAAVESQAPFGGRDLGALDPDDRRGVVENQGIGVGPRSVDQFLDVFISASTATVWWFGDRALMPPGFKNR